MVRYPSALRRLLVDHDPTRRLPPMRIDAPQKEWPHPQREAKPSVQNLWSPVCPGVGATPGLGRAPDADRTAAAGTALAAWHLPCRRRRHEVADGVCG